MATENNPMLPLFKEQLEKECEAIGVLRNTTSRSETLAWWYFSKVHGLGEKEIAEAICDGAADLAIDAIWIDHQSVVRFYGMKNPTTAEKGFDAGEVDKLLEGLRIILHRKHEQIANAKVRERVKKIGSMVPAGYKLFFVSAGESIPPESKVKLDAFVESLQGPSASFFEWEAQPLKRLQDLFYQKNLPAVEDSVVLDQQKQPYSVRSAAADCYFTHANARILAELCAKYGELLLQRNIRVDQQNTPTNRSIAATCTGSDSANFLHYNNGVTFLCDSAGYDNFQNTLTLRRAQIVNGGQTVRALHRAYQKGTLRDTVLVPVRVITSNGDKEFASNVAVNQNNQNQMRTGFLRSNDPNVVQLYHSLAPLGWYLERRDGELKGATPGELAAIKHKIGRELEGRVIPLKDGTQAYVATFFGQPELAKKDPKKMFDPVADGGFFERIFCSELTAEKFATAHQIKQSVDAFVKHCLACQRRKKKTGSLAEYEPLFGKEIVADFPDQIDQVFRQSSIFLCGSVYQDCVVTQSMSAPDLFAVLSGDAGWRLMGEHIGHMLRYAKANPKQVGKSWPNLLKSSAFFNEVTTHIRLIRQGSQVKSANNGS